MWAVLTFEMAFSSSFLLHNFTFKPKYSGHEMDKLMKNYYLNKTNNLLLPNNSYTNIKSF